MLFPTINRIEYQMIKIIPTLFPVTPNVLYKQLVGSTYDNVRKTNMGYNYTPAQFGGIFGQQIITSQGLVMEVTNYQVD